MKMMVVMGMRVIITTKMKYEEEEGGSFIILFLEQYIFIVF